MVKVKISVLFIMLYFMSAISIIGQQILISPELDLRSDFAYYLIPIDLEICLIRDKAVKIIYQKLDTNLNWSLEKELDLEGKKWNLLDALKHGNNIGLIYTARTDRSIRLYYSVFNQQGIKVFERRISDSMEISSNENISFQTSANKNFVSIGYRDSKNQACIALYHRFDDSIYYNKNVNAEINFNHGTADEAILTNKGELYLKGFERNPNKSKVKFVPRIIGLSNQGEKNLDRSIVTEFEVFSSKVEVRNKTNEIFFVGLCQEPGENNMIGYVIYNLTKDSPVNLINFDEKKIREWSGKKNSSIYSNNNLQMRNMRFLEDGSVVVFIESVKQYLRRPYFGNSNDGLPAYAGSRWIDYYFDDILVACIQENGEKKWETVLRKKQFSQDDEGINSSFFVMSNKSFLRVLFNDEIKNESTVSEYILLGDGKINRKSILNTSFKKLNLRIREAIQSDPQTLIIPSESYGRLSLLRLII